jgi:hypothetical protein
MLSRARLAFFSKLIREKGRGHHYHDNVMSQQLPSSGKAGDNHRNVKNVYDNGILVAGGSLMQKR